MEKKRIVGISIGIILIIGSFFYISHHIGTQKQEERWAQQEVESFVSSVQQNNNEVVFNTDVGDKKDQDEVTIDDNTIGVMTISSLNRKFPLTNAYAVDIEMTEYLLKKYAVVYQEYGKIGLLHHNAVVSAHSAINNVGCGHCYFDSIENLEEGEVINVLLKNGTMLNYEILLVSSYNDPSDDWFYDQPTDINESWITLITCTDGNHDYRTIVRAKLIS